MCACAPAAACTAAEPGDCDDYAPRRHPGAAEACNGVDDDCDGADRRRARPSGAPPAAPATARAPCTGHDRVRARRQRGHLRRDTRHAGPETCNGLDDDCDGADGRGHRRRRAPPAAGRDADLRRTAGRRLRGTAGARRAATAAGRTRARPATASTTTATATTDDGLTDAWAGAGLLRRTGNVADDCTNTGCRHPLQRPAPQTCCRADGARLRRRRRRQRRRDLQRRRRRLRRRDRRHPGPGQLPAPARRRDHHRRLTAAVHLHRRAPARGRYGLTCVADRRPPRPRPATASTTTATAATDESPRRAELRAPGGRLRGRRGDLRRRIRVAACMHGQLRAAATRPPSACDGLDNDCDGNDRRGASRPATVRTRWASRRLEAPTVRRRARVAALHDCDAT